MKWPFHLKPHNFWPKKNYGLRLINKNIMSNLSWPVFANWRNVCILLLWNQKSGGQNSGLGNIIGFKLCVLCMKTIGSDLFFDCGISHGMIWKWKNTYLSTSSSSTHFFASSIYKNKYISFLLRFRLANTINTFLRLKTRMV